MSKKIPETKGSKFTKMLIEEYLKGQYDGTNNEYSSQGTLCFTP